MGDEKRARGGSEKYLKKVKEFVDPGDFPYKVFNPDSDHGHSNGNVLRQSASST